MQVVQRPLGAGEEQDPPSPDPEGDRGRQGVESKGLEVQGVRADAAVATRQMKENVEISDDEFSALWNTHEPMLHSLCWRYASKYSMDIELMQQGARVALFDVAMKARQLPVEKFSRYLANTCRNRLIDVACAERGFKRNRVFNPEMTSLEDYTKDGEIIPLELVCQDPQPSWDIVLIVRKAVDRLPTKAREDVIAHYWDGESFRDIATRRGDKYDAVWMTHRRALQKLRKNMRCQI
jgi:RNA polymerase sigma factor (sigma-70 family)